jgi:hypothetical protein
MTKTAFEFLALFGCAAFTGTLLTIGISFGKYWKSLGSAELLEWFSTHPRGAAQAVPIVLLPTLVGLGGILWLEWADPTTALRLWIGAAATIGVLLVFTVAYFFPINGKFESKAIPLAQVPGTLNRWLALHWIRVLLGVVASLLAFTAVIS